MQIDEELTLKKLEVFLASCAAAIWVRRRSS